MTDEVQEGALPASESEELVAPEILQDEEEVQQPSVPTTGLTEDRLLEILDERAETQARKDQSAKDRAVSRNAKDIADILERFEASGGNKAEFVDEVDRQATLEATQSWQAGIESRLDQLAVPTRQDWKGEWTETSQKILDSAEEKGVVLSTDEYNTVMFNNGIAFPTKGDAEAALTGAITSKALGDAIPVSAVATEGGELSRPPEPTVPKTFRQQFDNAKNSGDTDSAQAVLDKQWEAVNAELDQETAKQAYIAAGGNPEDLASE